MKKVTYLSGGVGGAKFAKGLYKASLNKLSIIVNTGDDEYINGVSLSPDIDTVIYGLAGIEGEFGWGIKKDKFTVHEHLNKFLNTNFMIGDKETDIICANNYGIKSYRFTGENLLNFIKEVVF